MRYVDGGNGIDASQQYEWYCDGGCKVRVVFPPKGKHFLQITLNMYLIIMNLRKVGCKRFLWVLLVPHYWCEKCTVDYTLKCAAVIYSNQTSFPYIRVFCYYIDNINVFENYSLKYFCDVIMKGENTTGC